MALNTVIYYAAMRGIDYLSEAVTIEAAAPAQTETKPSAAPAKEAPAAKKAEEEVDEDDLFGGVDEEELAAEKKRREDEKKHKKKVEEIQRSNMYDPPHHALSLSLFVQSHHYSQQLSFKISSSATRKQDIEAMAAHPTLLCLRHGKFAKTTRQHSPSHILIVSRTTSVATSP